ncbi:hypothetical protein FBUS_02984 [Fasciolopsis buskii]|uniref:Uncharacterized protein n=1 Tax=Fasciolopsis buskii TaxID=27845 RepID=A0A8E0S0Y1_9TREM|nr:hypothetical protein FBUS_02984 [Fasciolopsis buski]
MRIILFVLQSKRSPRAAVRDEWKHRYYAAKKQAPLLEDRMNDQRAVLDALMRRAVASMRHCTTGTMELRTQAEAEGRLLMAELDRRRGEMSLVKSTSPNRRAYVFSLSPRRQQGTTSATHKALNEPMKMSRNREPIVGLLPPEPTVQRKGSMSSLSNRPLITRESSADSTETKRSKSATGVDRLTEAPGPRTSGTTSNRPASHSRRSSARSISPNPV